MLWLINQATAGDITGAQKPPAPPPAAPAAGAKAEAKKEGLLAGGGDASFSEFKIDMNA
jgi:hypothetical protein